MKIKNKQNLEKNIEKKIILIEIIVLIGILIFLFFNTIPKQIYPLHGAVIIDPDFVFEIENADQVILSKDIEFINPIVLEKDSDILLPPGKYYWKTKDKFGRESQVRGFTIQSHVGLNLREGINKNILENSGNIPLNITRKNPETNNQNENNKEKIIENFDLGVRKSKSFEKDDSKFEGEQK